MIRLSRVTHAHDDFKKLVIQLDQDLLNRYQSDQAKYDQYNILEPINTVVIAYDEDQPIGCGCFKPFDKNTVEMKRMFVISSYRGRKISKWILQELEDWAGELGFSKAVLETASKQPEAIGLYLKAGYKPIQPYGPYIDMPMSTCYGKALS